MHRITFNFTVIYSGSHCGRLFGRQKAKFNMANSARKRPLPDCFRPLKCVLQYSYAPIHSSISLPNFFALISADCLLLFVIINIMSNCHNFNWSSNQRIFFTFLSSCSFALPVIFLNAAAAVAAILLKRFFISYLLALSSVKVSTLP